MSDKNNSSKTALEKLIEGFFRPVSYCATLAGEFNSNGDVPRTVLWWVLAALACIVEVAGTILLMIVLMNRFPLFVGAIVLVLIVVFCLSSSPSKNTGCCLENAEEPISAERAVYLENTFATIKKSIFLINNEINQIACLSELKSPSQMDCPDHYDVIKGKIVIFHYFVIKATSDFNTEEVKAIFQNAIDQHLRDHDFEGFSSATVLIGSALYPSIIVDRVLDRPGTRFAQIDLTIPCDAYISYRRERLFESLNETYSSVEDMDF